LEVIKDITAGAIGSALGRNASRFVNDFNMGRWHNGTRTVEYRAAELSHKAGLRPRALRSQREAGDKRKKTARPFQNWT
jgi:hypothetical protein